MDQTHWGDGTDASLTVIQSDQQYSTIASGQELYTYEVPGLSGVGGGYMLQLADGTTTFLSADSIVGAPETALIAAPETKPTKRQGGRQARANQVNGGNQPVSLLKPLRPESSKAADQDAFRAKTSKSSGGTRQHQVSALQTNWQQQQLLDAASASGETVLMTQQTSLVADGLSEVKPEEKLYVTINGVPHEVFTDEAGGRYIMDSGADLSQQTGELGELTTESAGIGLAELATLSAERETLQLINYPAGDDGTQAVISQESGVTVQTFSGSEMQGGDQQYVELVQQSQDGTVVSGDHDTMQVFLVPNEGDEGGQGVVGGIEVKQGVQDLMFQHDPQFQEMVAKGFDLSNCILIQEDGQSNGTVYMTAPSGDVAGSFGQDLQHQLVSVMNSSGYVTSQVTTNDGLQSVAYINGTEAGIGSNSVLTILADPSTLQQHAFGDGQHAIAWSSLAAEEFDDGEFDYLKQDMEEVLLNSLISNPTASKTLPIDRYLTAYHDFVSGNKIETLSSVANSTVSKRPQLPRYEPELFPRHSKAGASISNVQTMTLAYSNESGSFIQKLNSRSVLKPNVSLKRPRESGPEDGRLVATSNVDVRQLTTKGVKLVDREGRIIKRKRKGSEDDSYDESEISDVVADSDPAWKPSLLAPKITISQDVASTPVARGRGRGRPRGSGRGGRPPRVDPHRSVESGHSTSAFTPIDLNEPHNYQKGDFVIERKDRFKSEDFPIWKIESGRLLQKYDACSNDTGILHKSVSVYSSWSGDVRTNFKAIMVEVITSTGRKCEIVKVLEDYLPKTLDDSLELDPLMELFGIYLQVLISQAVDSNFFMSIEQGAEIYYLGPMEQIDNLLMEAKNAVISTVCWNDRFKAAMEERPFCRITEPNAEMEAPRVSCEAAVDGTFPAIKNVKFYGPHYDRNSLEIVKEGKMLMSQDFSVSQLAAENAMTYHGLHHFKFILFKKCQEEVQFLKQSSPGKAEKDILEDCVKNRIFVQQGLRELKTLLKNCSLEITVVTKSEEATE